MTKAIDMLGLEFGRLTVLSSAGCTGKKQERAWLCQCVCGSRLTVTGYSLRRGNTKSCGCFRVDTHTTHGRSGTPEYVAWQALLSRCHNPKSTKYYMYGARGVSVCPSWRNSFEQFFKDMGSKPFDSYSVERLNGALGYSKANCVWASKVTQANNTRLNRPITYKGETLNLSQWSRRLGIPTPTLFNRLGYRKLSVEDAFTFQPFQRQ